MCSREPLCTSFPSFMFYDITLGVWHRLCWETVETGKSQSLSVYHHTIGTDLLENVMKTMKLLPGNLHICSVTACVIPNFRDLWSSETLCWTLKLETLIPKLSDGSHGETKIAMNTGARY